MQIIPKHKMLFKHGNLTHTTRDNGVKQEAPGWISQTSMFRLLKDAGKLIVVEERSAKLPSVEEVVEPPSHASETEDSRSDAHADPAVLVGEAEPESETVTQPTRGRRGRRKQGSDDGLLSE